MKWNLPEPIRKDHEEEDLFTLTWFEQPFEGYCMRMGLLSDGSTLTRMQTSRQGDKVTPPKQITKEQAREFRELLQALRLHPSDNPFSGAEVITVSFYWHGEHYISSFNESSCPFELQRLFEVANTTWEHQYRNPCQSHRSPTLETTRPISAEYPSLLNVIHTSTLFTIIWFNQPFTGNYQEVVASVDYFMTKDNFLLYHETGEPISYGELRDAEIEEIQELLSSLIDINPEQPSESYNTIITLGFPWEIDYHLLTFDTESCPDELQQLLEMSEDIMDRAAPGWGDIDNPCQGE